MAAPHSTDYFIADLPSSTMGQSPRSPWLKSALSSWAPIFKILHDNTVAVAPALYKYVACLSPHYSLYPSGKNLRNSDLHFRPIHNNPYLIDPLRDDTLSRASACCPVTVTL
jgi:hypothetical protein